MPAIDFESVLKIVRKDLLLKYLNELTVPCFESELLRAGFPEFEILTASPLELYRYHFTLFHLLYQFQEEFRKIGKYLHVHFMRTSVTTLPAPGQCRNFDDELGRFCMGTTAGVESNCELHSRTVGQNSISELSDRYFYADAGNFHALNEETAGAFLGGTWEVLAHHDKLQRAFSTLGLVPTSDLSVIRRRFTTLARDCHPDSDTGSHQRFCDLNNAYHLLLRLLSAFAGASVRPSPEVVE